MKTRIKTLRCAFVVAAFSCCSAFAADNDTSSSSSATTSSSSLQRSDRNFVEKASMAGMKEVAVSQAALPNLKNAQVRAFAQRMVSDHTHGNSEMMSLAARKGVTAPDMSSKEMKLDDKWSKASDDLDQNYMKTMVADHKKNVQLHEDASRSSDPEIAALAQKMLPTLREHLEQAQQLEKQVD